MSLRSLGAVRDAAIQHGVDPLDRFGGGALALSSARHIGEAKQNRQLVVLGTKLSSSRAASRALYEHECFLPLRHAALRAWAVS